LGQYFEAMSGFEARCRDQSDDNWKALLQREKLSAISFPLNETRELGKLKMDPALEGLAAELATNGYHGWSRLYDKMAGDLTVRWSENGTSEDISLGQLATKINSPDRETRRESFEKLTEAWKSRQALAALALNYQAGFRLSLYRRRGWESALDDPLRLNRMSKRTLDAMWAACGEGALKLAPYIEAKKKLLGIDVFRWYDETAPVGESSSQFTWDEAWCFVEENVGAFSRDMQEFVRLARDGRWVEAEDRPGKAGGGFCTGFPLNKETRIFMTFGNTYGDLSTLAHELGHSYHQHVLKDMPHLVTQYPMNLAETASTFNELLVIDEALTQSDSAQERLMQLDQKMQSALTFFCNIRARFLFDVRFYERRASGALTPAELSELMLQAQREAYGEIMGADGLHPLFWASKLHFFTTEYPFYNFPYTFGYLFATGVYSHAREHGASFAAGYRDMLSDTGRMSAEELARKHLQADLTQPDFWRSAVESALQGLDEFVALSKSDS
ncbi:MAG: M3 family oligoendopeptidase, partial [Candidatus Zixiibacteriota bacterium]